MLANPAITFEFHASIPTSSSSIPTSSTSSSSNVVIDAINPVPPPVTIDDAKTKKSNSKSANKKNKKSTPPPPPPPTQSSSTDAGVVEEIPAEMAVNAYTCHTPKVVLHSSQNSEVEGKKIRRQTSTRVEEAEVQFQVALPASSADATDANDNDDESVRTKNPWERIQRRADPALVSQLSGSVNNPSNNSGSNNKKKSKKSSESLQQQRDQQSSSSSSRLHTDSKLVEEGTVVDSGLAASEKLVLPVNAQRDVATDQLETNNASQERQLDANDGASSPVIDLDSASAALSFICEDSSVTVCCITTDSTLYNNIFLLF